VFAVLDHFRGELRSASCLRTDRLRCADRSAAHGKVSRVSSYGTSQGGSRSHVAGEPDRRGGKRTDGRSRRPARQALLIEYISGDEPLMPKGGEKLAPGMKYRLLDRMGQARASVARRSGPRSRTMRSGGRCKPLVRRERSGGRERVAVARPQSDRRVRAGKIRRNKTSHPLPKRTAAR
jgi:hypothetical protein